MKVSSQRAGDTWQCEDVTKNHNVIVSCKFQYQQSITMGCLSI